MNLLDNRRWLAPAVLLIVVATFLALRVPPTLKQGGSTDEEWYAIPGLTIAREGIPRVPYSRATDPGSVFLGAERLLFAMPPLSFYAQAPFFLVLPATCSTARLASLLAGCGAIALVYLIGRNLWGDGGVGLWAAGMYSLCRLLYFPAMIARPDMLCGTLGLAAIWAMTHWSVGGDRRPGWLAGAGVCLGLGGLTHPFALVFSLQVGLWAVLAPGPLRSRILRPLGLILASLAAFSIWAVLIVRAPELFRAQFISNILKPTGPGLIARLLWPWRDFAEHMPLVIDRAGVAQATFLGLTLAAVTLRAIRRRDRALGLVAVLGWSSVYLLVALQGQHPLQGYWCYPASFFALAAGLVMARGFTLLRTRLNRGAVLFLAACLVMGFFLPGSGLRTTWACVRHWNDVNYNPREFTRSILDDLPPGARLTVGAEYSLEAYGLRGSHVLLGIRYPDYFDSTQFACDYAILGRTELDQGLDRAFRGHVVRSYGTQGDPFSCYAVVIAPDPAAGKRIP